jgi:phosphatidylglycerol:prolipoprotein diacylglycerol transferase
MHPVLFQIGPLTFYSYGFMIAAGFWAASFVLSRRAAQLGWDAGRIQNVALVALLAGLVGARILYVAISWETFQSNWVEVFRIDHGGLVYFGGLLGGLLGGLWMARIYRFPLLRTVDCFMPALALAHAFGRIGCFLNGCCYGRYTTLPVGVQFPNLGEWPRHPTQLYETVFLISLFFFLRKLDQRNPKPGTVLLAYGALYGLWRFLIEFLRGDHLPVAMNLTLFQWISLALMAVCFPLLALRFFKK